MDVLIVEDQRRIAEGLSVMLSGCKEDGIQIEQPLIADNGVQALKILEQQSIDLVITDIRMPIMDGLELMRRCSVQHRDVPFIILSGYDDFKYAQKAIEYGAKAYLLKPVDRAALYAAIHRIDAEKRERGGNTHTTRQQLLLHYARSEENLDTAISVWHAQKIGMESAYYVAYTQFDSAADFISDPFLKESLLALTDSQGLLLGERDEVLTLCPAQTSAVSVAELFAGRGARATAISETVKELDALPAAYREAREIFCHRLLFPQKVLLQWSDIRPLRKDFTVPYKEIDKLKNRFGAMDENEIKTVLAQLFDRKTLSQYRIGYTLALCDTVYRCMRSVETSLEPVTDDTQTEVSRVNELFAFDSMREYLLYLCRHFSLLNEKVRQRRSSTSENAAMEQAEAFIQSNYQKQLTLAAVSNHVSLSYAYFSDAFRRYSGKTFLEYLRDIRVQASLKLLEQTELRISEVASAVGYDSYKTFARAFKEVTGTTPADYRKNKQIMP